MVLLEGTLWQIFIAYFFLFLLLFLIANIVPIFSPLKGDLESKASLNFKSYASF